MKRKVCKPNPAPPLLCWDIYAESLNKQLGITPDRFGKSAKKKAPKL